MKLRVIAIILMILGISFISYPRVKAYYYIDKQEDILNQWQEDLISLEVYNSVGNSDLEVNNQIYPSKNIEGTLKIDSINFYQPILKGATKNNLNLSVSKIDNTASMGTIGNYAIAGHNSKVYGRNFNRLHEVNIGDEIQLSNESNDYKYRVYDRFIVNPNETWVIESDENRSTITLITCDYSTDPSSRLIIKGEIK